MSGFWSFILNLVVFLVSLSALVVIHELGHLSAAKLFKVYCYEFSIGMGPAIYKRKPKKEKNQETQFSVRCLPIGGYVAMAGEDMDDELDAAQEAIKVPKERTLEGRPRYQQIIVMAAGVFMNFVLGYILYFISFAGCTQIQQDISSPRIQVVEGGKFEQAGLESGDDIYSIDASYSLNGIVTNFSYDIEVYNYSSVSSLEEYKTALTYVFQHADIVNGELVTISPISGADTCTFDIHYLRDGEDKTSKVILKSVPQDDAGVYSWEACGVTAYYNEVKYSFSESFSLAWDSWCNGCTAIFDGVRSLFTSEGWQNTGGIISIFQVTSAQAELGLASFLNVWALISVNLAIMNLLPFPGLDGWQILVTLFEGGFETGRKVYRSIKYRAVKLSDDELLALKKKDEAFAYKYEKVYKKVKSIMSLIGMVLLIGLAIVLIFKDIFNPVIPW